MAQNVGPILEMVTEKYLLRVRGRVGGPARGDADPRRGAGGARSGRHPARRRGDHPQLLRPDPDDHPVGDQPLHRDRSSGACASTSATRSGASGCWAACRAAAWASSSSRHAAPRRRTFLQATMADTKRAMDSALPFAMEPVVYDFAVNEHGTRAELLQGEAAILSPGYYALRVPRPAAGGPGPARASGAGGTRPVRRGLPRRGRRCAAWWSGCSTRLLPRAASDAAARGRASARCSRPTASIPRSTSRSGPTCGPGAWGSAQNRLPASTQIEDVREDDVVDATGGLTAIAA